MANLSEMVGSFMQQALSPTGTERVGNVLKDLQANVGGMLDRQGGAGGILDKVLDAARNTFESAKHNPAQAAGIGAILGGLLGGGGRSVSGAIKGGALAVLAGIAYKALTSAGQGQAGGSEPGFSGGSVPVAMTPVDTPASQATLAQTAELVIRAMINAAKADGQVSPDEITRIVGKLKEAGMPGDAEAWIMNELRQPLDLDAFAASIPNQEIAAQVYAASLLAVEIDTPAERAYLTDLAQKTHLAPAVVAEIQKTVGVTV